MRRQIVLVVGVLVLLGWSAVPVLEAAEAPAAAAAAFLTPAPAPASAAAADPLAGALFLAKPGGGGPTSCEVTPLCTNPPPTCDGVCKSNGFAGGACTAEGCCLCYSIIIN